MPWPWSKQKDTHEFDAHVAMASSMLAGDSQRTTSEIEMQRDLGTNFHMTDSQELMDTVKALAMRRMKVDIVNDGKVVRTEDRVIYHPVFTTLYIEVNRLHSMRWLDPIDAEIATYKVQYNFRKQKMKLTNEEYSQWGGVVDALERLALGAISDSLNGRKPKLLKVQPRTMEVQFNRPQKQQEGQRGFMP